MLKNIFCLQVNAIKDKYITLVYKALIVNKLILRMYITKTGRLGMMILAGTGTDKFTLKEAISKFVKIKDRFEPDKNIRTRYVDKFEKYKKYTVLFLSFINSHRKVLSSLINKNMFNIKQFNF